MSANGEVVQPTAALVPLQGVNISIGFANGDPTQKIMLVGPITFVIPVDEPLRKAIVTGLTGVQLAKPGDVL